MSKTRIIVVVVVVAAVLAVAGGLVWYERHKSADKFPVSSEILASTMTEFFQDNAMSVSDDAKTIVVHVPACTTTLDEDCPPGYQSKRWMQEDLNNAFIALSFGTGARLLFAETHDGDRATLESTYYTATWTRHLHATTDIVFSVK